MPARSAAALLPRVVLFLDAAAFRSLRSELRGADGGGIPRLDLLADRVERRHPAGGVAGVDRFGGRRDGYDVSLGAGFVRHAATVPARYLAAVCRRRAEVGGPGIGTAPGVPSVLASHGSAAANALDAKGQSWFPGWVTTAQLIPDLLPSAHSELAATA